MEVKVSVDGIPRVVCGMTQETTCQEVVLALAQALGQPGRYNLREKFKDFERCVTPGERLLETLERYGEQAKEVQLVLSHSAGSAREETGRSRAGRNQAWPPLRRKDGGGRLRRGSSSLSLHRQSLPPLSCPGDDEQKQEVRRPKRKSLTLMEEAWEWLESLGKAKAYSTASDRKADKKNRASLDVRLAADKENSGHSGGGKVRGQRAVRSDLDNQTSCCMGNQTRSKDAKRSEKTGEGTSGLHGFAGEEEKNRLREKIIRQLVSLQKLQSQMEQVDGEISELEEKQRRAQQEARERAAAAAEEETEQIQFWENELKAEEGYEKDLQRQFLEMRAKAVECRTKVEEYKHTMQDLHFSRQRFKRDSDNGANVPDETPDEDKHLQRRDPEGGVARNRTFLPPLAPVPPAQIKERRPTGPTELREWWRCWSEAQKAQNTHNALAPGLKVVHRSELTIYLGSTKV